MLSVAWVYDAQVCGTKLDNLVTLCRHHHRAVHEGGFDVRMDADGQSVFYDQQGKCIPEVPETRFRGNIFALRKHVFPTGTGNGWTLGWWWMSVRTRPPRTGAECVDAQLLAGDDNIVDVATGKVNNPVGNFACLRHGTFDRRARSRRSSGRCC